MDIEALHEPNSSPMFGSNPQSQSPSASDAKREHLVGLARDHRQSLLVQRFESYQAFNKMANWLGAGGVAALLIIVERVERLASLAYPTIGFVSLVLFGVCLVASVSSMLFAGLAYDRALRMMDASKPSKPASGLLVLALNALTAVALVLGLISLLTFIAVNFRLI